MYFSHCDRILTESLWGEIERTMGDVIAYPGVQEWWKTRRHWHTEENLDTQLCLAFPS